MGKNSDKKLTEQQRRNLQFAEERLELLDTIRYMIDIELDRRGVPPCSNHHSQNPPHEPKGRDSSESETEEPGDRPRRKLWQRIVHFFSDYR